MNLILLEPHELAADGAARLTGTRADHVRHTLKGAPGHELRVGLIDGPTGVATITAINDQAVSLECRLDTHIPERPPIDLLLALPRPKVMRRLWAQLAAIGVGRIVLTNAEKVERDYFDTHILQPATYRPLLVEGLQQARDTRLPEVSIHKRFKVLIEDELDALCPQRLRWAAHPDAPARIAGVIRPAASDDARSLLAIGPEGGWNAFELALLESRGFAAVSLGPRALRTDTACIAMLTLAHAATPRRNSGAPLAN